MFETSDEKNAGLSYVRVSIGASDFTPTGRKLLHFLPFIVQPDIPEAYSFDDDSGDTGFEKFNIDNAPAYLFEVLSDIKATNGLAKVGAPRTTLVTDQLYDA